jgi:hypothetical protein
MYEGSREAAAVPALKAHIADVLQRLSGYVDTIPVVDDHNADGTAAADS